MKRLRISIRGIVQGVGFRPFVVRLATESGLRGEVRNLGGRVEIIAEADPEAFDSFLTDLRGRLPPQAEIVHLETAPYDGPLDVSSFRVVDSGPDDEGAALFPPDLPVCPDCLRELADPADRRFGHALISCQSCGPRYTILDRLPFDRENTAMAAFSLCPRCAAEYAAPQDRRFHAQTVSCPDCGPRLGYRDLVGEMSGNPIGDPLHRAADRIRDGGLVAVKGIGGYHLVCRTDLPATVDRLRRLKGRDQKPFAVLFADLDAVRRSCAVTESEATLLLSRARPIVLLDRLDAPGTASPRIVDAVFRDSRSIGAFLPYTPIQVLLLETLGIPLVATSANVSDQPILTEEADVFALVGADGSRPDGVLHHDRLIRTGLDDSVAQVSNGAPQLLRRARGYTPLPVYLSRSGPDLLAVGADLKASFSLARGPYAYPGPFFGDLATEASYERFAAEADRMASLFGIRPTLCAHDLHPGYLSTRFARATGLPLRPVQHHHAHIASVLAEHGLEGPVIGVAFDGTGFGTDGTVWGGEFLLCEGAGFERVGHLRPLRLAGGDSASREGWKTAFGFLRDAFGGDPAILRSTLCRSGAFGSVELARAATLFAALEHEVGTHVSSSAGRLFDAASALLGICPVSRYEAEAAILLEKAAWQARSAGLVPRAVPMSIDLVDGRLVADPRDLIRLLAQPRVRSDDIRQAALDFHEAVALTIRDVCTRISERTGVQAAALSGGVFQNRLLAERCGRLLLESGFRVYFNRDVPPNDGGIALGQTWVVRADGR